MFETFPFFVIYYIYEESVIIDPRLTYVNSYPLTLFDTGFFNRQLWGGGGRIEGPPIITLLLLL